VERYVLRVPAGHVGRNLELYLMGVSVALALAVPLAIEIGTNEQELASAALAACVIQGLVFWLLRRRYRRVRGEMITELRAMLQDRINNYLTVVLISVTQRRELPASSTERELLEAAIAATAAVSRVLDELSMESLRSWKSHYRLDEPAVRVAEVSPRRKVASS
jgi:peptidoglycan biosynthesis protein MviN/MurJ (putative lipid II flippase)